MSCQLARGWQTPLWSPFLSKLRLHMAGDAEKNRQKANAATQAQNPIIAIEPVDLSARISDEEFVQIFGKVVNRLLTYGSLYLLTIYREADPSPHIVQCQPNGNVTQAHSFLQLGNKV